MPAGDPGGNFGSNYGYGGMPGTTTGMAQGGYASTGNPQIDAADKYQGGALAATGQGGGWNYSSSVAPRGPMIPAQLQSRWPTMTRYQRQMALANLGLAPKPAPGTGAGSSIISNPLNPLTQPAVLNPKVINVNPITGRPVYEGPPDWDILDKFNPPLQEYPEPPSGIPNFSTGPGTGAYDPLGSIRTPAAPGPGGTINKNQSTKDQSRISSRQFGGPVAPGTPYQVGENGPETFVPQQPGQIMPNNPMDRPIATTLPAPTTTPDPRLAAIRAAAMARRQNSPMLPFRVGSYNLGHRNAPRQQMLQDGRQAALRRMMA